MSLALAVGVLASLGVTAHADIVPRVQPLEALADTVGYCNLADLTGDVDYDPAIQFGTTAQPVSWLMHVHFNCTGTGIYNGTYDLTIAGSGNESCHTGTGIGTVVGGAKTSGPGTGPIVGGSMKFRRETAHYYISHPENGLNFTVHETETGTDRPYEGNLWLDLPDYLKPYLAADVAVSPILDDGSNLRLPSASLAVSVAPGPCVDRADLKGHGTLGQRYTIFQPVDDAVEALIPAGL
jgi:hypothetical protein